jgi:hypothetical protein
VSGLKMETSRPQTLVQHFRRTTQTSICLGAGADISSL